MDGQRTRGLRFLLILVSLGGLSCSQGDALHPVQGKVLFQGQPLSGATVVFHPQTTTEELVNWPIGQTADDGTFSVATAGRSGAATGQYAVTIVCPEAPVAAPGKTVKMSMGGEDPPDRLKGAYADPTKSKLQVEVKEGVNQLEPFALQ